MGRPKGVSVKEREKQEFKKWLCMTQTQRLDNGLPVSVMAVSKLLNVSYITCLHWRDELNKNNEIPLLAETPALIETKKELIQKKIDEYDPIAYLKSNQQKASEKLVEKIMNNKANAKDFELYYKLIGRLDKEEKTKEKPVDVNINIKSLIAIADKQLDEAGIRDGRVVEVPEITGVLHRNILSNTGQGNNVNPPVPDVGIPEDPAEDIS